MSAPMTATHAFFPSVMEMPVVIDPETTPAAAAAPSSPAGSSRHFVSPSRYINNPYADTSVGSADDAKALPFPNTAASSLFNHSLGGNQSGFDSSLTKHAVSFTAAPPPAAPLPISPAARHGHGSHAAKPVTLGASLVSPALSAHSMAASTSFNMSASLPGLPPPATSVTVGKESMQASKAGLHAAAAVKLFVGQLPLRPDVQQWVEEHFAPYGVARVQTRPENRTAFVWMRTAAGAEQALRDLHGMTYVNGRMEFQLTVERSHTHKQEEVLRRRATPN